MLSCCHLIVFLCTIVASEVWGDLRQFGCPYFWLTIERRLKVRVSIILIAVVKLSKRQTYLVGGGGIIRDVLVLFRASY